LGAPRFGSPLYTQILGIYNNDLSRYYNFDGNLRHGKDWQPENR